MLDDDVLPEVGAGFVRDDFGDGPINDTDDRIVRDEGGLFALEVGVRRAIREDDPRDPAGCRDIDRRDIASAVETLAAIPGPARFAVIGIGPRADKEFLRRVEKKVVWGRPHNTQRFMTWQCDE